MTRTKIFNVVVLVIVLTGVFGLVGFTNATSCTDKEKADGTCYELQNPLGTTTGSIPALICKVLDFLSKMVMPPVAVFMALYASFLLLTSAGSPGRVTSARQVLVFTVIGAGIILLSVPIVALVMSIFSITQTIQGCGLQDAKSTFLDTFIKLINWFSWFVAVLSVAVVLYSGFVYMTGRGEPQKVAIASKMFVYAVIGIAVAVIAFSIIALVKGFIGL